ncbi:hypothetical protein JCM33374_g1906 [Metschnikowia sp. JCM 33374]|nr:hypothetical protein JCM33374_g1906 [Metschnikowia sp. JCM 33374]
MSSMPVSQVAYLVASQVATKAVTFISNQALLRRISPDIFGIAAYLEFVINTVLFFSREAVRMASQRAKDESVVLGMAWLPVMLCGPIFAAIAYLQTYSDLYQTSVAKLPYFHATLSVIVASIVLELLAEPWFALNQYRLNFKLRSKVESMAVFFKCITVFLGVVWFSKQTEENSHLFNGLAVLAFACGQLAYAIVVFGAYAVSSPSVWPYFSSKSSGKQSVDHNILSVWKSLFMQMIFKHLLTEGDTMLTSYLFTVTQQGVYSVISNYGSMVARLLFQPVEESLRVSFTRTFSQKDPDYKGSQTIMGRLMTFYFNLSLLIVVGGYSNGSFLLNIILGRNDKWQQSSVFEDFPIYVLYIPFMAFNGILEAFFSSASTQAQIGRFSLFMSLSSVLVFALMYLFIGKLGWGIRGLIFANIVNMCLRIVYCLVFYANFFKGHVPIQTKYVLSKIWVPVLLSISSIALHRVCFHDGMTSSPTEFLKSILICIACFSGMLVNEREQIHELVSGLRSKGKQE